MVIEFSTDNCNCPPIHCLPIPLLAVNCSITLQCTQANYALNPRGRLCVPSAHVFILLCQCKVETSQIQYSNRPKHTAQHYNESPKVFNKFKALNQWTPVQQQAIIELQSHATLKLLAVTYHSHL